MNCIVYIQVLLISVEAAGDASVGFHVRDAKLNALFADCLKNGISQTNM